MGKPKVVLYLDDKKYIQHCFICRPSDSTVSEDAEIEIYVGQRCTSYIVAMYDVAKSDCI
jgi:hypothetical protein